MSAVSEVEYAVMESNGELSVIPKARKKPLTAEDMSISKQPEIMPVVFISDGIIYSKNICQSGWTEKQLAAELSKLNISDSRSVFLAFCDGSSKLHVYMHDKDKKTAKEITK